MKEMININLLSLFYTLISIIIITQTTSFEIIIIPDASHNATAAFASLDELKNIDFLFFKFDLKYHNQVNQNKKDEVYFKITTELSLSGRDFRHIFLDKILEEVNSTDLDDNNHIVWKYGSLLSKEKTGNDYNYYIHIKKFGVKIKGNTLIIRIPILKNEGQITIENLFSLPEEILEKENKIENINIWPKNNSNKNSINQVMNSNGIDENQSRFHDYNRKGYKDDIIHHRNPIYRVLLGIILGIIWICIFILYLWTNWRKNNQFETIRNFD